MHQKKEEKEKERERSNPDNLRVFEPCGTPHEQVPLPPPVRLSGNSKINSLSILPVMCLLS